MHRALCILILCLPTLAFAQDPSHDRSQAQRQALDLSALPPFGFDRHTVTDRLDRTIEYYLSKGDEQLPLVLFIPGSGCGSLFGLTAEGQVYGGLQNIILSGQGNRVRVMVVEKPGVSFGDQPDNSGIAHNCSDEFLFEHTADRWTEAIRAALADALDRPATETGIDPARVLVMGHSEGGDMAAHVTAALNDERPGAITHTACLAGAGVTQLFDMMQFAWNAREPDEPHADRQARVDDILATWDAIAADPDSTTAMAWGHPHRRWSSFMAMSPAASLEHIAREHPDVALFLAQGTADTSAPVESFDAALARVLVAGGTPEVRRIPGADHALAVEGQEPIDGLQAILTDAVKWFLSTHP